MPQTATAIPKHKFKTTRRHNRSCDQCRQSKRACDAAQTQRSSLACSSCMRIRKICTFEGVRQRKSASSSGLEHSRPSTIALSVYWNTDDYIPETLTAQPVATASYRPLPRRQTAASALSEHSSDLDSIGTAVRSFSSTQLHPNVGRDYPHHVNTESSSVSVSTSIPAVSVSPFEVGLQDQAGGSELFAHDDLFIGIHHEPCFQARPADSRKDLDDGSSQQTHRRRHSRPTLADFGSGADSLAEKTNKSLISASLDRIYCDSLENALLCWVTEQTCPYNLEGIDIFFTSDHFRNRERPSINPRSMVRRVCRLDRSSCGLRKRPLDPTERQLASHALHATILAFAAQWSHLKSSSNSTLSDDRPDGSSLSHQRFGGVRETSSMRIIEQRLANFDRALQEGLWNEARRALQQAEGIDSSQVAFAQAIFAFTQRPVSREHFLSMLAQDETSTGAYEPENGTVFPPPLDTCSQPGVGLHDSYNGIPAMGFREFFNKSDDTHELLGLEKLQIHVQGSLIPLSTWRLRLNRLGTRHGQRAKSGSEPFRAFDGVDPDLIEDRMTFNQLFWLVMMCDTLSAAIHNRLPVVSDEDSVILAERRSNPFENIDAFQDESPIGSISARTSSMHEQYDDNPWDQFFLRRKPSPYAGTSMSWPFTTDDATLILSEAAPVKALLYRKIRRVQTLGFRREQPHKLEEAISNALRVYEHWSIHFGSFITTCIQHHDELPPQIQSWYTVLTGHWNLATFILTDLIEDLDRSGQTDACRSAIRQSCGLLQHIKRQSAFEMADMGKVGRAREYCSFRDTSDTHPALNDGALLTEPWTEIMVRSFSRCSKQLLYWLTEVERPPVRGGDDYGPEMGSEQLRVALQHCVEALWDIGRISDSSLLLAISFQRKMSRLGLEVA